MTGLWILLGGLLLVALFVGWHAGRVERRRAKLRALPLGEMQRAIVTAHFPLWEEIPPEIRAKTEGWMQVFLAEKNFEPCGGLEEVTEEMRLSIAAPACVVTFGISCIRLL